MKSIIGGVTAGVFFAGAAIGLASSASAQLTEGSYTWTTTGGGFAGVHSAWVLSSCGQDCLTVRFSNGDTMDLHLQGNAWTGANSKGCTYSLDNNSLAGHDDCPGGAAYDWQLTKNG
jgi:hypothetical protein